ncbi:alanine/glycine:cation symporter family protein [Candidatus Rariloculus sp.]|uniref:alanine/glycine:cation symporter family protein n=1 Tax=Candidatus Rariloculus sp. TaxID=3101265 RepID=UPI003D150C2D
MDSLVAVVSTINNAIWHDYALLAVLGAGVLFTFWSGFGQYRALTHGVAVITGKYDDKSDPGAINHFQALSTALSATVGLGNIAGVAIAISLGGPGALFWMWMVGVAGMCLKMTEVTQSMLFRDTSDPGNPHGGPMWVCRRGIAQLAPSLAPVGTIIGVIFSLTLLVSTATGGNMFQAWNVADISFTYFGLPRWIAGVILTLAVGLVIIGGIKRIGEIAGRIVPFMCATYLLAGLLVIVVNISEVPAIFALIFTEAFSPSEGIGAFIGGTAGYGFLKGLQRAFFSSEAGQGSAPIAHSAAKTNEPVREGVVAGLEPFIDTIVVCTVTGLVILSSGVWNRDPALVHDTAPSISPVIADGGQAAAAEGDIEWQMDSVRVTVADELVADAQMRDGTVVFVVVEAGANSETGLARSRVFGTLTGSDAAGWTVEFDRFDAAAGVTPTLVVDGVFFDFKGASLTAKAFDRVFPGLGIWIVPMAAWLFAFSTIISWGYYGEQGIVYLLGQRSVMSYRVVYCMLILVSVQFVRTQDELDLFSTFGTGLMLWVNVPIMLIFGPMAMRAYHDYFGRLRRGEMVPARTPRLDRSAAGHDAE